MSQMEKLKALFDEMGLKYTLTDDSEESELDEDLDTIVEIYNPPNSIMFMFKRDGTFKELFVG